MASPSGFSHCHLLLFFACFILSSCAVSSMPCMISSRCSMMQSSSSSLLFHIVLSVCCMSLRLYDHGMLQLLSQVPIMLPAFVVSQHEIFCSCFCHGSVAIFPPFCLHAYSLPFLLIQSHLFAACMSRFWSVPQLVLLSFFPSCSPPFFQLASHHCCSALLRCYWPQFTQFTF